MLPIIIIIIVGGWYNKLLLNRGKDGFQPYDRHESAGESVAGGGGGQDDLQ